MTPHHDDERSAPAVERAGREPARVGVRVVRFGDAALLVELDDLAAVRRVDDALRAARAAAVGPSTRARRRPGGRRTTSA
ncbi:hypothetical protein [Cellulomonas persica]